GEAHQRCAGAAEAALGVVDHFRDAQHQREPGRGARLQVAPRTKPGLAMKSLFWLLAVFAGAVALVLLGRFDSGYALFIYPPYRIEVSMLFFAVAALFAFALGYTALRLLGQVVSLP